MQNFVRLRTTAAIIAIAAGCCAMPAPASAQQAWQPNGLGYTMMWMCDAGENYYFNPNALSGGGGYLPCPPKQTPTAQAPEAPTEQPVAPVATTDPVVPNVPSRTPTTVPRTYDTSTATTQPGGNGVWSGYPHGSAVASAAAVGSRALAQVDRASYCDRAGRSEAFRTACTKALSAK